MDINETARRILAAKGINPDTVPDPEPFNPAAFLTELAAAELAAALPGRFVNATTDHPEVLGWVRQFVDNPHQAPSLLILGNTGTGKTHAAIGALRAAVHSLAARRQRITWRFTTHPDLNTDLRPRTDDRHLHVFDACIQADLLVIDDLGAGMVREWTADTLGRIVNTRWSNYQATIFTSNLPPRPHPQHRNAPNLLDTLGDRVVSRLADGTVVRMTGTDRRRAREAA